jgi:hypothetical protein
MRGVSGGTQVVRCGSAPAFARYGSVRPAPVRACGGEHRSACAGAWNLSQRRSAALGASSVKCQRAGLPFARTKRASAVSARSTTLRRSVGNSAVWTGSASCYAAARDFRSTYTPGPEGAGISPPSSASPSRWRAIAARISPSTTSSEAPVGRSGHDLPALVREKLENLANLQEARAAADRTRRSGDQVELRRRSLGAPDLVEGRGCVTRPARVGPDRPAGGGSGARPVDVAGEARRGGGRFDELELQRGGQIPEQGGPAPRAERLARIEALEERQGVDSNQLVDD